ncbi:MAG: tetratricopeptide repeat protein, partial [Brevinematales bacterium]
NFIVCMVGFKKVLPLVVLLFSCQTLHRIEQRIDSIEAKQVKDEEMIQKLTKDVEQIRKLLADLDIKLSNVSERVANLQREPANSERVMSEINRISKDLELIKRRVEIIETRFETTRKNAMTTPVTQPVSEAEASKTIYTARELIANGQIDQAIEMLNSLLARGYSSYELRTTLGDALFRKGETRRAIREWMTIINDEDKINDKSIIPRIYLRVANAFLTIKDEKNAKIMLQSIIAKYPQSPEAKVAEDMLKNMK